MENQVFIRKVRAITNFTIVLNKTITDGRLSMETLGVLVSILSLPDDWVIRKNELQRRLRIGRRIIDKCFDELAEAGYLVEGEDVLEGSKFAGKTYVISGVSNSAPDVQNVQRSDVQNVHSTDVQNVHLLNKQYTTKNICTQTFEKPTFEQVAEYAKEKHGLNEICSKIFAEKFWNFYESKGWMVGRSKMKNWKSAVSGTWKDQAEEIKNNQKIFMQHSNINFKLKS